MEHPTAQQLKEGLAAMVSPRDEGKLELIVRRPERGRREVLEAAELNPEDGLMGDCWKARGSSRTPDGKADPDGQLTLMNSRVAALLAGPKERWSLSGDQLFVDLDLSADNLPPGTRLAVGTAEIMITGKPHTGCKSFVEWFGPASVPFVNSPEGMRRRLRGACARVLKAGTVRAGDMLRKLP